VSDSKLFTSLLVADAAVREQIELTKPVVVENEAKIAFPAREGRRISWLDLCVHRSGLPRLPSNLSTVSARNPYRGCSTVNAAEFLSQHQLAHKPGERVIVLSNTAPGNQVDQLAMELITRTVPSRMRRAESPPSDPRTVDPKRLEGLYQLAPNFIFDVRYDNGHLMVGITNQPTQEVFADSPTKWSYRSVDATLEFHLRSKGPAYALTLHQNGAAQRVKRVRE
jgi:hypothetical protein